MNICLAQIDGRVNPGNRLVLFENDTECLSSLLIIKIPVRMRDNRHCGEQYFQLSLSPPLCRVEDHHGDPDEDYQEEEYLHPLLTIHIIISYTFRNPNS